MGSRIMKLLYPASLISAALAWSGPTCKYKFSGAQQVFPTFDADDNYKSHTVNKKAMKRLRSLSSRGSSGSSNSNRRRPNKNYNNRRGFLGANSGTLSFSNKRTRQGRFGPQNKRSRTREEERVTVPENEYSGYNYYDDYEEIDYEEEQDYDNNNNSNNSEEEDYEYVEVDYDLDDQDLEKVPRVIMLLDATDSMKPIKTATIDAYNRFLNEQKSTLPNELHTPKLTTIQFEYWFDKVSVYNDIMNAQSYTERDYIPSGCTSMYDAIACTIEQYKEEKNNIFMIITDGDDTCSGIYNEYTTKDLIDEMARPVDQGGQGWQFTFQGANVNSKKIAQNLGINMYSNFIADNSGIHKALNKSSKVLKKLRSRMGQDRIQKRLRSKGLRRKGNSNRRRPKLRNRPIKMRKMGSFGMPSAPSAQTSMEMIEF